MSATLRLYWDDPLLVDFTRPVLAHAQAGERAAFVLAESAFYPEAGGQMADRGRAEWDAGMVELVDAQEDADGRVLHVLAPGATLPPLGAAVRVTIDAQRRRDHMAQHTGQHMLSRALLDRAGGETLSSRLGESVCTIDTQLAKVADEALADAEAAVAAIVLEDRPIRALRPSAEELARLPLRRDPKVSSNVRIVDIDGFDLSPCGGTHCIRTGQVGPVRLVGVERYKGGTRLSFRAGARALREDARNQRVISHLGALVSAPPEQLVAAVERLAADVKVERRTIATLRARLGVLVADALRAGAPGQVVAAVLDADALGGGDGAAVLDGLRAAAARLVEPAGSVALLAARAQDATRIVFARGPAAEGSAASRFDAGAALRRVTEAAGGRGGGRADRAEGQVPPAADLEPLLAAERARIEASAG